MSYIDDYITLEDYLTVDMVNQYTYISKSQFKRIKYLIEQGYVYNEINEQLIISTKNKKRTTDNEMLYQLFNNEYYKPNKDDNKLLLLSLIWLYCELTTDSIESIIEFGVGQLVTTLNIYSGYRLPLLYEYKSVTPFGSGFKRRTYDNATRLYLKHQHNYDSMMSNINSLLQDLLNYNKRDLRTSINYYMNDTIVSYANESGNYIVKRIAVLDNKTSDICIELDGYIFDIRSAVVGREIPPNHPHCRTFLEILFDKGKGGR